LTELTTHVSIEPTLVPDFQEFMLRHFKENKTHIREILAERWKKFPEKKTLTTGLYGCITAAISYDTILEHYDATVAALL
jgi:hypothetical protein